MAQNREHEAPDHKPGQKLEPGAQTKKQTSNLQQPIQGGASQDGIVDVGNQTEHNFRGGGIGKR